MNTLPMLSEPEREWLEAYVRCGNATQAAIDAKLADPSNRVEASLVGARYKNRAAVKAQLAAVGEVLADRYSLSLERWIEELMAIGFGNPVQQVLCQVPINPDDPDGPKRWDLDFTRLDPMSARALSGVKWDKHGNPVISSHDKIRALELLAKHAGFIKERVEIDDVRDPVERLRRGRARALIEIDAEETGEGG